MCYFVVLPPDDFEQLLDGCQENRPESWREFDARFKLLIVSSLVKALSEKGRPTSQVWEDLLQDVYLKLCRNGFQALRGARREHDNSIYAYVKAVAYSTALDHLRRTKSLKRNVGRTRSLEQLERELAAPEACFAEIEKHLLHERIDAALEETTESENAKKHKAIFWLYYRQGLTAKEIAAIPSVGLAAKGVESLIYRMTTVVRSRMGLTGKG